MPWSNKESLMRFIYYGASGELMFVGIFLFLLVTAIGLWRNTFMWGCVRVLEGFANGTGRLFAWAGLLMVLQQIIIIFMQRVFAVSEISLGFGMAFTKDVSWWSEELKLYNAMIVCMCAAYTFVQGGQVRVDLLYANMSYRTKRAFDMLKGSGPKRSLSSASPNCHAMKRPCSRRAGKWRLIATWALSSTG